MKRGEGRLSRRDFLKSSAALSVGGAALLSGLIPEAEGQKCEVVFRNWGGFFKKKCEEAFTEEFGRKYNCRVIQDIGTRHTAVIQSQAAKPQIDIVILYLADPYLIKDLLAPITAEQIPNLKHVYPKMNAVLKDGRTIGAGFISQTYGIAYNPKKIAKPTSWEDLFKPELKKKVTIPAGGYVGVSYLLSLLAHIRGGGTEKIEPGFKFLEELRPQVLFENTSAPQVVQAFERGEVWAAPFFSAWTFKAQSEGIAVDFSTPKEGVLGLFYTLSLIKNCPNPEMGLKLIDLALAEKAQVKMSDLPYPYGPANRSVVLPEKLQRMVPYGEEGMAKTFVPDFEILNENRAEWVERWNKVMAG